MSVFGGDSWSREAHHRKRRVDDLMLDGLDASSFKKLSNGKFTCLVCPNRPHLDSSLMLYMHGKGSRHRSALSRLKENEINNQEEMKKRIAVSDGASTSAGSLGKKFQLKSKPLIEQTRKASFEIFHGADAVQSKIHENWGLKSSISTTTNIHKTAGQNDEGKCHGFAVIPASQVDFRERREKELKFTAAGWKRDCHGKWYRDENVEFDSDEEDPNICLA